MLEGLHALKHALRFGAAVEAVYTSDRDRLAGLAEGLCPDVSARIEALAELVPPAVFAELAPHAPETGVLSLALRPDHSFPQALEGVRTAPVILLEAPAHLGNVGAVIRVAAAAGAAGVVTTGPHDPWDPAALCGSAGLHFAQPVLRLPDGGTIDRPLVAIDPEGETLAPASLPANAVYAFGSERQGLSPALLDRADRRLSIPMARRVSSLNLATAVAVTLYAWRLGR